ncbi:hypothetical protein [Nitrosomonas sp.]|uniref:hypothetical protein n=1 Tax=Nitrosomonas sp. TaxID=42353 RepID=UPI0025CD2010|nr:hypothetical protein [Nitrosomonas sp.]MBV6448925.1 hypothetical protein [Nitrosomonas sp.]
MKINLIQYIIKRIPSSFFIRAVELMESEYFEAHQVAERYEEPERYRVRGQLRHYGLNRALRAGASEAGLVSKSLHTSPKGDRYSIVIADDIHFGRVSVPFHCNRARPSKYRYAIANVNSRFESTNGSLFEEPAVIPSDGMGCLIVTVNPPRFEPQSVPSNIIVGVPYTNLRGWHLFEPISTILAAYNKPTEINVPDLAWVKLKKQLDDCE